MPPCVPLIVPRADLAQVARVTNSKTCTITHDRHVGDSLIVMRGGIDEARIRLPRDSRPVSALNLRTPLLVLQASFDATEAFALEVGISHSALQSTRLLIGTHIKDARQEMDGCGVQCALLPLIVPRGRMVQVIFHVSGILEKLFRLAPFKAIESVALLGTAKVRLLSAGTSEQVCIESTPPHMPLFAVPAYTRAVWASAPRSSLAADDVGSDAKQTGPTSSARGGGGREAGVTGGGTGGCGVGSACGRGAQHAGSATPSSTTSSVCHSSTRSATPSPSDTSMWRGVPTRLKPLMPSTPSMSARGERSGGDGGLVVSDAMAYSTDTNASSVTYASPRHRNCITVHYIRLVDGDDGTPGCAGSTAAAGCSGGGGIQQAMSNSPSPAAYSSCRLRRPPCEAHTGASCTGETTGVASAEPRSSPLTLAPRERLGAMMDAVCGWDTRDCAGTRVECAGRTATVCGKRDKLTTATSSVIASTAPAGGCVVSSNSGGKPTQSATAGVVPDGPSRGRRRRNENSKSRGTTRMRDGKAGQPAASVSPATLASEGVDGGGEAATTSLEVARRRQRARRRMRLLRANERQQHGALLTRFIAASELPLSSELSCADEDSVTLTADVVQLPDAEPKCGYGFGYLGVLRDDGEYEIDEAANLQLKGALSLRLSDEDE